MPKRSRSVIFNSNKNAPYNPLSDARRGAVSVSQEQKKTSVSSKADRLWHRKSGAGNYLFLSYYSSQPIGVVTADGASESVVVEGKGFDGEQEQLGVTTKGMSRAAIRRRRKKKAKTEDSDDNIEEAKLSKQQIESIEALSAGNNSRGGYNWKLEVAHPPLCQAFKSRVKSQFHLKHFVSALSKPLPLTFRLRMHNPSSSNTTDMKNILAKRFGNVVTPVAYDPKKAIYQSSPKYELSKRNLSKLSPDLKEVLVGGSMNGILARQELGSMLPVLGLEALGAMKAGSKVLDLCSSPGSKTMQALELIAAAPNPKSGKRGRIIANDIHPGRLDALRDAVERSGLPQYMTSRVSYTNFDASVFPPPKSGKLFDAIICDVPCSGDGTIRKDVHILPTWSPNTGNALHGLQSKILVRALELIRVDGTVCYSTCSLNPIEDEAVVAAAVQLANSKLSGCAVKLVEWPENIFSGSGFIRRKGVNDWKVAFYDQDTIDEENEDFGTLKFCSSYEEAISSGEAGAERSFWADQTNYQHLFLDRCTRLFPQDHDSGGFFLAFLQKVKS